MNFNKYGKQTRTPRLVTEDLFLEIVRKWVKIRLFEVNSFDAFKTISDTIAKFESWSAQQIVFLYQYNFVLN